MLLLVTDRSEPHLSYPLLLQTFKPIRTTGDENCMYHALSLSLIGSENVSYLLKTVVAHALLKFRASWCLPRCLRWTAQFNIKHLPCWELAQTTTSLHSVCYSIDLYFITVHFMIQWEIMGIYVSDVREFAQRFKDYHVETRGQILYCSSAQSFRYY